MIKECDMTWEQKLLRLSDHIGFLHAVASTHPKLENVCGEIEIQLNKMLPKKVIQLEGFIDQHPRVGTCPTCGDFVWIHYNPNMCDCAQNLIWDMDEDEKDYYERDLTTPKKCDILYL